MGTRCRPCRRRRGGGAGHAPSPRGGLRLDHAQRGAQMGGEGGRGRAGGGGLSWGFGVFLAQELWGVARVLFLEWHSCQLGQSGWVRVIPSWNGCCSHAIAPLFSDMVVKFPAVSERPLGSWPRLLPEAPVPLDSTVHGSKVLTQPPAPNLKLSMKTFKQPPKTTFTPRAVPPGARQPPPATTQCGFKVLGDSVRAATGEAVYTGTRVA